MPTPLNHGMEESIHKLQGAQTNHLTCLAGVFCEVPTIKDPSDVEKAIDLANTLGCNAGPKQKVKLRQHKLN